MNNDWLSTFANLVEIQGFLKDANLSCVCYHFYIMLSFYNMLSIILDACYSQAPCPCISLQHSSQRSEATLWLTFLTDISVLPILAIPVGTPWITYTPLQSGYTTDLYTILTAKGLDDQHCAAESFGCWCDPSIAHLLPPGAHVHAKLLRDLINGHYIGSRRFRDL